MPKISKEVFKDHVTITFFTLTFKTTLLLCLFFLLVPLLNFDFTISTFWNSIKYFGNINSEVLLSSVANNLVSGHAYVPVRRGEERNNIKGQKIKV